MDFERDRISAPRFEVTTHHRGGGTCSGGHVEETVVRASHVDEDAPGADSIKDGSDGEILSIDDGCGVADGARLLRRPVGMVVVAAANRCQTMAFAKLLFPEVCCGIAAAIDNLNRGDEVQIHWLTRCPPAAHADFARGRFGMID